MFFFSEGSEVVSRFDLCDSAAEDIFWADESFELTAFGKVFFGFGPYILSPSLESWQRIPIRTKKPIIGIK